MEGDARSLDYGSCAVNKCLRRWGCHLPAIHLPAIRPPAIRPPCSLHSYLADSLESRQVMLEVYIKIIRGSTRTIYNTGLHTVLMGLWRAEGFADFKNGFEVRTFIPNSQTLVET